MNDKTNEVGPEAVYPLFVLGLDDSGKPRGARFAELNDIIVSTAMDMKCAILVGAPVEVTSIAMKLPIGRVYASGKAFIPNIRRDLYDSIREAVKVSDERFDAEAKLAAVETSISIKATLKAADAALAEIRCKSPMVSGLPRTWEDIGVGHMVLSHESLDDGWWEAVVINRDDDILTLRFRDYPKQPTFIRHISTVALVNPGLA